MSADLLGKDVLSSLKVEPVAWLLARLLAKGNEAQVEVQQGRGSAR